MYGNNYFPNGNNYFPNGGGQGPMGWNQGDQGQGQAGWNQPPQMQPPLIYHFRGLRIDEAWPNGLGRRAYVMRPRTFRGNRPNEYLRGNQQRGPGNFRAPVRQVNNIDLDDDDFAPVADAVVGDYRCFICGELMQNSEEQGVHLCGGDAVESNASRQENDGSRPGMVEKKDECQCDLASLEELLRSLRKAMRNAAAVKTLGSCVKNLDIHQKTIDKELERLTEDFGKKAEASARKVYQCLLVIRQNFAAWRVLVQKAAEETQRRGSILSEKEHKVESKEKEVMQKRLDDEKEIKRQIQELEDEKERISEIHEIQKGRVRLDVGGRVFSTSVSTLTRDPESMLAAMFSGRHEVKKEKDGSVFIDRDGTNFRYILNYLRDGMQSLTALPKSRQSLRELRNEATFYQLFGLVQKVEKLL